MSKYPSEMHVQDGLLFVGLCYCWSCNDEGVIFPHRKPCEYRWRGKHPKSCNHCLSGEVTDRSRPEVCRQCNGEKRVQGTLGASLPVHIWESLEFRVYRSNRKQSYNENLLGFGCIVSVTDYGEHRKKTDEELIADVKRKGCVKGINVAEAVNKERTIGKLCNHVGIFCSDQGYSVRAVFESDASDAQEQINQELPYAVGMMYGTLLAGVGLNGTLLAVKRPAEPDPVLEAVEQLTLFDS